MRFAFGVAVGLFLGVTASVWAAGVFGSDGDLEGWSVTKDDEEVCADPFVHVEEKEIECQ